MYKTIKYIIDYLKYKNYKSVLILETSSGQGTELLSSLFDDNLMSFINFYLLFTKEEQ